LVQFLDYIADSDSDMTEEYPMYPIETLFNGNGGGDCEDKAILTCALLQKLNVFSALMRFDNHMAVGVRQPSGLIPSCDYYIDDYYFLETTTEGKTCGFIPSEYEGESDDAILYPISLRPVLVHNWKDASILIYRDTELGDFVKVTCIISNLGSDTAEDLVVEGGFFTQSGLKFNEETYTVTSLEAGKSKKVILKVNIPSSVISVFKTRLLLDDEVVDERESIDYFP